MEVLYYVRVEFGIHMKLVRLIKICMNETYSRVRVGKHLVRHVSYYEWFEIQMLYRHCFSTLL